MAVFRRGHSFSTRLLLCVLLLWLPAAQAQISADNVDFRVLRASLNAAGDSIEVQFDRALDTGHALVVDNASPYASPIAVYHAITAALGNWVSIDSASYGPGADTITLALPADAIAAGEFVTVLLDADAVRDTAGNGYRGHTLIVDNQVPPDSVSVEMVPASGPAVAAGIHFQDTLGAASLTGTLRVTVDSGGAPVSGAPVSLFRVTSVHSWSQVATANTDGTGVVELPAVTIDGDYYVLRAANAPDRLLTVVPTGKALVRGEVNSSYSASYRYALLDDYKASISNGDFIQLHGADRYVHYYRVPDTATAVELRLEDETIPWGTRTILHREPVSLGGASVPSFVVDYRDRAAFARVWHARETAGSPLSDVVELQVTDAADPEQQLTFTVRGPADRDREYWVSNATAPAASRWTLVGKVSEAEVEPYAMFVHLVPAVVAHGDLRGLPVHAAADLTRIYAITGYSGFGTLYNDYPVFSFANAAGTQHLADARVLLRPFYPSASSRRDAVYLLADAADDVSIGVDSAIYVLGDNGLWYYLEKDWSGHGVLPLLLDLGGPLGIAAEYDPVARGTEQAFILSDSNGYELYRLIDNSLAAQPYDIGIATGGSEVASTTTASWTVPADAAVGSYQAELRAAQGFPIDPARDAAVFEVYQPAIDGLCGADSGSSLSAAPGADLCAAGVAGSVTGGADGPWWWSCAGEYGGTDAYCSANPQTLPPADAPPELPPLELWPELPDDDGDQIPDYVEGLAPNPTGTGLGDGNGDGIADALQNHVTSLPLSTGDGYATVVSGSGAQLDRVEAQPAPADLPSVISMPYGMLALRISGLVPGATETLTIHVPRDEFIGGYYKQDVVTGHWRNVADSITHVGQQTQVTLRLTDGGAFDLDGVADGAIDDPGGVVHFAAGVPTLGEWALLLTALLLLTGAAWQLRRSARPVRG